MIGGHDIVLPFGWEPEDRDRILRFFRHRWSDGMYEDAAGGYAGTFSEALRFAPAATEFFVYPTQEAWTSWEAYGGTEATRDSMIHVLGNANAITLVTDAPDGALRNVAAELIDVLTRNRFIGRDFGPGKSAA